MSRYGRGPGGSGTPGGKGDGHRGRGHGIYVVPGAAIRGGSLAGEGHPNMGDMGDMGIGDIGEPGSLRADIIGGGEGA